MARWLTGWKKSATNNTGSDLPNTSIHELNRAHLEKLIRPNKSRADFAGKIEELNDRDDVGRRNIEERFYAFGADGSEEWRYTIGGEVGHGVALRVDGTIYFGSADGKLHALATIIFPARPWLFVDATANGSRRSYRPVAE